MNRTLAKQLAGTVDRAIGARDWPAAERALEELENLVPADAWVRVQQSYVQSWQGHFRKAHALALSAAALPPPNAETLSDVVWRLRTFNEVSALENYVNALGDPSQLPLEVLPDIAAQFSQLNRFERARELLEVAHRRMPAHPAIAVALAQNLSYLGLFDRARGLILDALQRAPQLAEGWWQLSVLPDDGQAGEHARRISTVIAQSGGMDASTRAVFKFAEHRFLDSAKAHEAAAQALLAACRLKHDPAKVAAQRTSACVDALLAWQPSPDFTVVYPATDSTPVFIVGMHRSGTTLLEQLLSAHGRVAAGGEMYDFTAAMREATDYHCKGVLDPELVARAGAVDFHQVGQRYVHGVASKLTVRSHFTDKLPTNFFNLGFICAALPQARILHLVRDPMEVCFSNLRELFSEVNHHTYAAEALADYYADYLRLMAHWKTRWPGRILDVHYEALTRDIGRTLREVSAFCGLPFEEATLSTTSNAGRAVATASVAQVRSEVTARREPKWKPYAPFLKPLTTALERRGIEFNP